MYMSPFFEKARGNRDSSYDDSRDNISYIYDRAKLYKDEVQAKKALTKVMREDPLTGLTGSFDYTLLEDLNTKLDRLLKIIAISIAKDYPSLDSRLVGILAGDEDDDGEGNDPQDESSDEF